MFLMRIFNVNVAAVGTFKELDHTLETDVCHEDTKTQRHKDAKTGQVALGFPVLIILCLRDLGPLWLDHSLLGFHQA